MILTAASGYNCDFAVSGDEALEGEALADVEDACVRLAVRSACSARLLVVASSCLSESAEA